MDSMQAAAERAVAAAAAKERSDIEASVSSLVADLQSRMAALASEVSVPRYMALNPSPTFDRHPDLYLTPQLCFVALSLYLSVVLCDWSCQGMQLLRCAYVVCSLCVLFTNWKSSL